MRLRSLLPSAAFLSAALTSCPFAGAQHTVEPVVNPDHTVTFRYDDPAAKAVALNLDIDKEPDVLQKGADGVWTWTSPVLKPEIYGYRFTVDGRSMMDSVNPKLKTNLLAPSNQVLVPGTPPEPWEMTAVPHGELHTRVFTTAVATGLDANQDNFIVYTPPGYDPRSNTKYPVLYLLHGFSDTSVGWTESGRANLIFDSLIAAGKMKPMVVVMPLGYGEMSFVLSGFDVWHDRPKVDSNVRLFGQMLLTEVVPQVERSFNVSTKRDDRAIAGLSMGGLEALTIGLEHTDKFAYVGGFSSAVHLYGPEGIPDVNAETAKHANLKLLWIACGTGDSLAEPNRKLEAELKAQGFHVTAVETPGLHMWEVWRENLVVFAPLLFR